MKTGATQYLEVTGAKYVSGYKLLLTFNDGAVRVVDFGPFLVRARNPDTTDYRDPKKFKSFHIQDGDLMWGDYQMIFPIMDLYQGTILKGEAPTPAHFVLSESVFPSASALGRKNKPVSYKKSKRGSRVRTPKDLQT
jgi:hypothetical protein